MHDKVDVKIVIKIIINKKFFPEFIAINFTNIIKF